MFLLMSKIEFVEWFKSIMDERGLINAKLAELTGLSESQIGRIKSGEQGISIDTAVLLAHGLGVTPVEVFYRKAGIEPVEKNPEYIKLAGYYDRLDENRRKDLLDIAETLFKHDAKK